jgi:zinc protease
VDSAIQRGRNLLLSAARRRQTHPDLRIHHIALLAAFPDHPYGLDPEGTEQSLAALTAEDLERYRAEQFVQSRMLLVVVGDVARAEVESLVVGSLGRLPVGAYAWAPPPAAPKQDAAWLTEHRPLSTNYILGYFHGPQPTDDDYFAFQIATALLSGRLGLAVREQRSLSYAAFAPFLDRARPAGGMYASTAEPGQVFSLMLREIGLLRSTELAPYALRDFQSQFTLDRLGEQMTNESQAEALGRAAVYFGDFRMADESWERFRRVRAWQVRRTADRYMRDFRLAYLGDTTLMSGKW